GNVYSEDENGKPIYDFPFINSVYAQCVAHGIKPVVEMDFVPEALARPRTTPLVTGGDMYERCSYPADWDKWRALLVKFTENLVETFGIDEVRTWYFEAWNEPDLCALVPFIQQWPAEDWDEFMHLYDVFVDAVTSVDDRLKVGGPGGCTQAFMYKFFEHVCRGKNYVTGETGTRIDFVSYHFYGMIGFGMGVFPLEGTSVSKFVHELYAVSSLMAQFPKLKGIEFHLNEWGECAQGGLNRRQYPEFDVLRNSEYSALYLVKLIPNLMKLCERSDLNLTMLLYWGFTGEDDKGATFEGTRGLTTYPRICKPLWTAYEMLAGMGDRMIECDARVGARVSAYGFKSDSGVQLVAFNFEEDRVLEGYEPAPVKLQVEGLEPGKYTLTTVSLGRKTNNTFGFYKPYRDADAVTEEVLQKTQAMNDWQPDSVQTVEVLGNYTIRDTIPDSEVRFYFFEKAE
ncbi:MAG: hypothetical protein IKU17_03785, partial [Clostridia bacterium]|nr:hypothetical protein [Clostridia bacterium]